MKKDYMGEEGIIYLHFNEQMAKFTYKAASSTSTQRQQQQNGKQSINTSLSKLKESSTKSLLEPTAAEMVEADWLFDGPGEDSLLEKDQKVVLAVSSFYSRTL